MDPRKEGIFMRRRHPSPAGHSRFAWARLVLILLLLGLVLAAAGGLSSCLFQPMLTARGTLLFLPAG